MADTPAPGGCEEVPAQTLEGLERELAGLSPEAIAEALETLTAAGVLTVEAGTDGKPCYRYSHPERYKLINAPVVKLPGPDFGRRG